jgi:hypothetical protein
MPRKKKRKRDNTKKDNKKRKRELTKEFYKKRKLNTGQVENIKKPISQEVIDEINKILAQGDEHFYNKNFQEALNCYDKALKKHGAPISSEVYLKMGITSLACRKFKEAEKFFNLELELSRSPWSKIPKLGVHYKIARIYSSNGYHKQALVHFKKELETRESHPYKNNETFNKEFWLLKAKSHQTVKEIREAKQCYQYIVILEPCSQSLLQYAILYKELNLKNTYEIYVCKAVTFPDKLNINAINYFISIIQNPSDAKIIKNLQDEINYQISKSSEKNYLYEDNAEDTFDKLEYIKHYYKIVAYITKAYKQCIPNKNLNLYQQKIAQLEEEIKSCGNQQDLNECNQEINNITISQKTIKLLIGKQIGKQKIKPQSPNNQKHLPNISLPNISRRKQIKFSNFTNEFSDFGENNKEYRENPYSQEQPKYIKPSHPSSNILNKSKKHKKKLKPKQKTQGTKLYRTTKALANFTSNQLTSFNEWYNLQAVEHLIYSIKNLQLKLKAVFINHELSPFSQQLDTLKATLTATKQEMAYFISMEPSEQLITNSTGFNTIRAMNTHHFIFGMLIKDTKDLFIINPIGLTNHKDFYQTLQRIKNSKIVKNIYIANNPIQKITFEPRLKSCAPLCVELMRLFSSFSRKKIIKILKNNVKCIKHGLTFFSVNIQSNLPKTLFELTKANKNQYINIIKDIRKEHQNLLLPEKNYMRQKIKSDNDYWLQQCENNPMQQILYKIADKDLFSDIVKKDVFKELRDQLTKPENQTPKTPTNFSTLTQK